MGLIVCFVYHICSSLHPFVSRCNIQDYIWNKGLRCEWAVTEFQVLCVVVAVACFVFLLLFMIIVFFAKSLYRLKNENMRLRKRRCVCVCSIPLCIPQCCSIFFLLWLILKGETKSHFCKYLYHACVPHCVPAVSTAPRAASHRRTASRFRQQLMGRSQM